MAPLGVFVGPGRRGSGRRSWRFDRRGTPAGELGSRAAGIRESDPGGSHSATDTPRQARASVNRAPRAWPETSEPTLCGAFVDFLTKLVEDNGHLYAPRCALPPSGACHEDRFNGPSHVRQMLVNQCVALDVQGGELSIGRWQDIAYTELDG